METTSGKDLALSQLQSKAHTELLDAVDELRKQGFHGDIDLPQLIVCGNQSSGKSSVLEAISGVRFPASNKICTRFASELILRRKETSQVFISIIPALHRTPEERKHLQGFQAPSDWSGPLDFARAIEAATDHINSLGDGCTLFEDKLRAEICGPGLPQLTLVDLPGIIQTTKDEKRIADVQMVTNLVESYMKNPKSVILAVLAADNDFESTTVLHLAKDADPERERTLGVITKPDRVPADSPGQEDWIGVAGNDGPYLKLGWHVLKNRDWSHRDICASSRDSHEAQFFTESAWRKIPEHNRGVDALREKLSKVLLQSIRTSLPGLTADIAKRVEFSKTSLEKLGQPRLTVAEQRAYLIGISTKLQRLVEGAVQGNYRDQFFGDLVSIHGLSKRLRSVITDENEAFAIAMRYKGQRHHVMAPGDGHSRIDAKVADFSAETLSLEAHGKPIRVTNQSYIDAITLYMGKSRGCELPGSYAPGLVGDIFRIQSGPWEQIAENHIFQCWNAARIFFEVAVAHVAPLHTCSALIERVAEPAFERILEILTGKLHELLRPYKHCHPITYDEGYIRMVQRYQVNSIATSEEAGPTANMDPNSAGSASEASDILYRMQAYYKVALNTFVDNVATLAIECCLFEALTTMFSPEMVVSMEGDMLDALASEPDIVVRDRETNKKRLVDLEKIQRTLRRHGNQPSQTRAAPKAEDMKELPTASSSPLTPEQNNMRHIDTQAANNKDTAHPYVRQISYATPPKTPPNFLGVAGHPRRKSSATRLSPRLTELEPNTTSGVAEDRPDLSNTTGYSFSSSRSSTPFGRGARSASYGIDEDEEL